MGSKWRKAKQALGLKWNLCYHGSPSPSVVDDDDDEEDGTPVPTNNSFSGAALLYRPVPSRLPVNLTVPSQKKCSICLASMKAGDGHAIFTAECTHVFHFNCITLNVKHGNQSCPVCRAKWKEIPIQGPSIVASEKARSRSSAGRWPQHDTIMTVICRLPSSRSNSYQYGSSPSEVIEPAHFDDDEPLNKQGLIKLNASESANPSSDLMKLIHVRTYPETSAFPSIRSCDTFAVLIQLEAAVTNASKTPGLNHGDLPYISQTTRTPVDLVTVLDISGSMAGTKLALLKRAMGFVIQTLSSNDRLSVIAFSSTARRLFPLQRMTESGRQQALQAVNSLVANGGTNIAEGLRKGAKVTEERREKNPVSSIVLLSDGQDTYTVNRTSDNESEANHQYSPLPSSLEDSERSRFEIPVHTFGFGTDHDASSMHSISETSGGTFSFIETEAAIQDAFAQCIGGLLSVVAQQLQLNIECVHPAVCIRTIKAGSYPSRAVADRHAGYIDVGDLYADEERYFLVYVNVPMEPRNNDTSLFKVRCVFKDPALREMVTLESEEVKVWRPLTVELEVVSIEVDSQRNRLNAAEAMSQARAAAERSDLAGAASILENCRKVMSETVSAKRQDQLCVALDAELKEMQERLASWNLYESSGRAYILSGLSSHSWQRATTRGDSTDSSSVIHAYITPSMVEMLTRSEASLLASPASSQRLVHPGLSFSSPKPR